MALGGSRRLPVALGDDEDDDEDDEDDEDDGRDDEDDEGGADYVSDNKVALGSLCLFGSFRRQRDTEGIRQKDTEVINSNANEIHSQ